MIRNHQRSVKKVVIHGYLMTTGILVAIALVTSSQDNATDILPLENMNAGVLMTMGIKYLTQENHSLAQKN